MVTILHVEFTEDYLNFFLKRKNHSDGHTCLKVDRSKSHDLATKDGRLNAATLVIALCNYLLECEDSER
jgi:hypothetical protein